MATAYVKDTLISRRQTRTLKKNINEEENRTLLGSQQTQPNEDIIIEDVLVCNGIYLR